MLPSVYDYSDYKHYIREAILAFPSEGRGIRKRLADAMNCQLPFVSQVLNGDYHLSLEQAFDLATFFELNIEETDYFMSLVSLNRSSHQKLGKYLKERLLQKKQKTTDLRKAVKITHELSSEDQAIYYSHWAYAGIHMLLTIPNLGGRDEISKRLRLPLETINRVLDFLVSKGLVSQSKGVLKAENVFVHLSKDSHLLPQHHRNFRLLATESVFQTLPHNMHYSSAVTCSKADFVKVRKILEEALSASIDRVKSSKEEVLAVLNFDWFSVGSH